MKLAYYRATLPEFLAVSADGILGELTSAHGFALDLQQKRAWLTQIASLKDALRGLSEAVVLFEFTIPRMGKRADVVLLLPQKVLVLEYKVGSTSFDRSAIDQVHDYALDLKNFHAGSLEAEIVPIVIASDAPDPGRQQIEWASDRVAGPILASCDSLQSTLVALASMPGPCIDPDAWQASGYKPTPTIIEAAQALYHTHRVDEITRSDAGAKNLAATTDRLQSIIDGARVGRRKVICFVTGVPGAGKTLVGLNIATKRAEVHDDEHAVFLSGNGPLVEVLREALARDKATRDNCTKSEALRQVKSFIQPIHHFRDAALRDRAAPIERVVVFDEAQRAWSKDKAVRFMRDRGNREFDASEPEFLISVMDRQDDWCVIVCLVGGGQEINTGEAGLSEWLHALQNNFPHWQIYISDRLADRDYVPLETTNLLSKLQTIEEPDLHLAISMRSFRAESLTDFVSHLLENRPSEAMLAYEAIAKRYPIVVTRCPHQARRWLKKQARGSERYGVLASSGAKRLRPEGFDVRLKADPAAWFLNDRLDVRSAFYCEEVATEFDVQGLELDWAAVCWDGDLRRVAAKWQSFEFRGTRWQRVHSVDNALYLKNAYRVLLTRARQGMVIYVPRGDAEDPTRPPEFYDETYAYLISCGLQAEHRR